MLAIYRSEGHKRCFFHGLGHPRSVEEAMIDRTKNGLCILVVAAAAAGCSGSQAAVRPSDMPPEAHCAAAELERMRAQDARLASEHVHPTKTAVENRQRIERKLQAEAHESYAASHEQAALAAAGASDVAPCSWMRD